jgi:hypothetical protein
MRLFSLTNKLIFSATLLALTGLVLYAFSISIIPIDNFALFSVFDHDESSTAKLVLLNFNENSINPHGFFNYGYVMHSMAFLLLKAGDFAGFSINYFESAYSLKLVVAAFFVLSVIVFYGLLKSLAITPVNSLLIACAICLSPAFFYWGFHIHPDVVQVPLIGLAILTAIRTIGVKSTLWSYFSIGVFFGLAVGTKYAGIFAAPFFVFLELAKSGFNKDEPSSPSLIGKIDVASLTAIAVFFLVNPYALPGFEQFIGDINFERQHVARGHGSMEPTDPFLWLRLVIEEFGTVSLALVSALLLLAVFVVLRTHNRKSADEDVKQLMPEVASKVVLISALAAFAAAFGYLMLQVNMRRPRYLFHLYPLVVVIVGSAISVLRCWYERKFARSSVGSLIVTISLFIVVASLFYSRFQTVQKWRDRYQNSVAVDAGNYLARVADPGNCIIAGIYSYVPEIFHNRKITYRFDDIDIEEADYLVLNSSIPGRHIWPVFSEEQGFRYGNLYISRQQIDLLKPIFEEDGWSLIWKSSEVLIFRKNPGP